MKITVTRKALLAALTHCCAAATKNSTMPILKCVQLTPSGDGFTLRSVSEGMKMGVTCEVKAQVTQPEAMCINAHDLLDRVKALPEGDIKITTKDGKLTLQALNRKLGLSYLSADDYPKITEPAEQRVTVPAMMLAEAIKSTLFAASDDYSRPAICAVHIKLGGGSLTVEAADGKRIAVFTAPCDGADFEVLVPKASAILLRGLLDGATGDVLLSYQAPTFHAVLPSLGMTFGCATLDETQYPPIAEFMSRPTSNACQIVTQTALDAVKSLSMVSSRLPHVVLSRKGNTVKASTTSDEADESSDEFMATGGGDFDEVRFEAQFLIDALAACGSETVELALSEQANSWAINGGKTRHLIAPQKVG